MFSKLFGLGREKNILRAEPAGEAGVCEQTPALAPEVECRHAPNSALRTYAEAKDCAVPAVDYVAQLRLGGLL